jgi:hypothetical protein
LKVELKDFFNVLPIAINLTFFRKINRFVSSVSTTKLRFVLNYLVRKKLKL